MKQIERYGVIALLFMLVTIVTVALWDEGSGDAHAATKKEGAPTVNRGDRDAERDRVADRSRTMDELRSTRANERRRATLPLSGVDGDDVVATREEPASRVVPASLPSNGGPRPNAGERPDPGRETRTADDDLQARGSRLEDRRKRANQRNGRDAEAPRGLESSPNAQPPREEVTPTRAPAGSGTYVVVSGDSLERIARRILGDGNRWPEIQAMNGGIDPKRLLVGMELVVPTGAKTTSPRRDAPESTGPAPKSSGRVYVVKSGDILGRIAQNELGSAAHWPKIAALNPTVDPKRLPVGAELKLPEVGRRGGGQPARSSGPSRVAKADPPAADNPYVVR